MVARVLFPWLPSLLKTSIFILGGITPTCVSWRNTIVSPPRATIKAHSTPHPPPSPLRNYRRRKPGRNSLRGGRALLAPNDPAKLVYNLIQNGSSIIHRLRTRLNLFCYLTCHLHCNRHFPIPLILVDDRLLKISSDVYHLCDTIQDYRFLPLWPCKQIVSQRIQLKDRLFR